MKAIFILLLTLICWQAVAQEKFLKNQEFSFSIGFSEHEIEKFAAQENLDFINYFDANPDYLDYIIVKFGYKFDFMSKMSADIKLILMDDLIPDNYDIVVHYFLKPWLGMGAGTMLRKNYITSFEQYHVEQLPNYYLLDENLKQFTTYDLSFYLSPAIKIMHSNIFKLQLQCDLGVSSFMKEEAAFYHKKKLSNEKQHYFYATKTAFQPYIQPKLDLSVSVLRRQKTIFGILLNSHYYYANRSMNYERTLQTWITENSITEFIKPLKHNFRQFEVNVGIFLRWH